MGKAKRERNKVPLQSGLIKESLPKAMEPKARVNRLGRPAFHYLLILVIAILAYSNSFDSPFQWDESDFIVNNPVVRNLGNFWAPSQAKGIDPDYSMFLRTRYVGYLTFALNYQLHGFQVPGYHIFNMAVHILNAILVYLFMRLTFQTPFLTGSPLKERSTLVALFSALLFVSHPVQTEAVTYIFQRHASLVTFFYLSCIVLYVQWRLKSEKKGCSLLHSLLLYGSSFLACILAMKTKENAFTLPFSLTVYEVFFFSGPKKKRLLCLIPFYLTLAIIPLSIVGTDRPFEKIMGHIADPASFLTKGIPKEVYLFTQFRVLATYLRLLFLPIQQNLDYDYPLYQSFFVPEVFLSLLFHMIVLGVAAYLFYRSRRTLRDWRVVSFGILWFYLTLSVESSIIPLKMIICEYRIYLPSVGLLSAGVIFLFIIAERVKPTLQNSERYLIVLLLAWSVLLGSLTYARNEVWRDPVSLWEDVTRKSPSNARGYYNLGLASAKKGRMDEAIRVFQTTLKLDPREAKARLNLGLIYDHQGQSEEAVKELQAALALDPKDADIHYNLGVIFGRQKRLEEAAKAFQMAIELNPGDASARNNLGVIYVQQGRLEDAMTEFKATLRIDPDHETARRNLQKLSGQNPQP